MWKYLDAPHGCTHMNRQKALKMAIASQQIYSKINPCAWAEIYDISDDKTDTQASILRAKDGDTVIVFRGSESRTDWANNLRFRVIDLPVNEFLPSALTHDRQQIVVGDENPKIKVHRGFHRAYMAVRDKVYHYVGTHAQSNITLTGHSLGGAIAILFAYDFAKHLSGFRSLDIVTFGSPKPGNAAFISEYSKLLPHGQHYVNGSDIVPSLPRWWQGYPQQLKSIQLGSTCNLRPSARIADHLIEEYITALES